MCHALHVQRAVRSIHGCLLRKWSQPLAVVTQSSTVSTSLLCHMQDTPGWSGSIYVEKYIQAIVHFILQQEEKDYEQFQGSKGLPAEKMSGELKHTVTACVYFLAPHDIKPVSGSTAQQGPATTPPLVALVPVGLYV